MKCKNKVNYLILILMVSVLFITGCSKAAPTGTAQGKESKVKLGITQIVEHQSLDDARKGFMDALAANGYKEGENLEVEFQNAQGDIATAQTIAQNFASNKKDMILAIATPTAQAAYNATKEIPILITAVTDPVKAGLVKSFEVSGTNVSGTTDAAPIEKQFELLKKLVPAAKKVGILYNTSEVNSEVEVEKAKKIAPQFGLEIVTSGITNVNDISQSLNAMIKNIDVLYAPADNTVASAMPLISSLCTEKKIPVIGAVKDEVKQGALATEGIDYYKLGYQTGEMAVEILKGRNPKEMPVAGLKETELVINMESAKKLGISIPEDLKAKATIIKAGE